MSNYAISLKRTSLLLAALTFTALLLVVNFASFFSAKVGAEQLQNRSLTLSSTLMGTEAVGDPGDETNGSDAVHTVQFDLATAGNVGGIGLEYCRNPIGTCDELHVDEGLVVTGATLASQTGLDGTFSVTSATNNIIEVEGTPIAKNANDTISVSVEGITNPTVVGTFFVRVTTWATTVGDGSAVDDGTVASAITEGIVITARVAETLGFSTTADIDGGGITNPSGMTECDPVTGSGVIALGDPSNEYTLSITETYDAWSAFRLYTNSANGVTVQYEGELLTKGTDDIDSIGATATATSVGDEQFGLAVASTADGNAGQAGDFQYVNDTWGAALPTGTPGRLTLTSATTGQGDGTIGTAGNGATFAFIAGTPTTLAEGVSYVECDTAAVRYVANISPLTPAGTYTTTIVYSAVPSY